MTPRPLRLATYNVEWFNALFDDHGRMLEDSAPSTRYKISRGEQLSALGVVFSAMDADGIMIIEAPTPTAAARPSRRWRPSPRPRACARTGR
jgi:hypothetical protein